MSAKTHRLFESDRYLDHFEAKIIETRALPQGQGVVLDHTVFYPEGGGQPSDLGMLDDCQVTAVFEDGGAVVHVVKGDLTTGDTVKGKIDWNRRFDHMQQHTGQHLLSQMVLRILHGETASFHLGSEESTIDLNLQNLSEDQVRQVETETNRMVFENRKVQIYQKTAEALDSVPLRKRPDIQGPYRIVEIEQLDWSLCCGTHVRRTGEIGLVKILRWERYKGGIRVSFICGSRAVRDYQRKAALIQSVSQILTAGENEIIERVVQWKDERRTSGKKIQALLGQVLEEEANRLIRDAKSAGSFRWISATYRDRNPQEVQQISRMVVRDENVVALLAAVQEKATVFFACSGNIELDMRILQEAVAKEINGKGGGGPRWAQCSTFETEKVEKAMADVVKSFNPAFGGSG